MNNRLKPVMFVGTGSDVGKSVINTAFCRIFKQDGYNPAPYKAQNMSLNSYATPEGLEIGRAQAVQAEACKIDCHTDMNPVLLKPTTDMSAQVVLNGKPIGNQSAKEYFLTDDKQSLFDEAYAAFERLEKRYNPIVLEGAGSISELNLKKRDIVNMRMAIRTGASVYLIADIDKGGVIASVYGTVMLLDEDERKQLKGIIINKFRGDIDLFTEGRQMIEDLTKIPVVGVIPFYRGIHIEEEDSVMLEHKARTVMDGKINVVVVLLGKMANFTDFNSLEHDERAHLFYSNNVNEIEKADIVIIPGSKNTISDLLEIRRNGVAAAIIGAAKTGKTIIGICGGYQMMGQWISDPEGIEGSVSEVPGLGILPVKTEISDKKETIQTKFRFKNFTDECSGYEIHMGRTTIPEGKGLNRLKDGTEEGFWLNDKAWGTYMHGILDNKVVLDDLLKNCKENVESETYEQFKDRQYEAIADHVRGNVDMDKIYREIQQTSE